MSDMIEMFFFFISCLIEVTPVCNICPWLWSVGQFKTYKYTQHYTCISKRYCTLWKCFCKSDITSYNKSCHQDGDIGRKLSNLRWNFESAELPLDHGSQFLD